MARTQLPTVPASAGSSASVGAPAGVPAPAAPAGAPAPTPAGSDQPGTNPKQKRMLRLGIAFIVVLVVGFLAYLGLTGQMGSFLSALAEADPWWVAAGIACWAGFFALEALCFRLAGLLTGERLGAADLISVAAAGIVFGYLTPGQTGAAPAQIVRLSQVGLKVGDATAVQLVRYFMYQAAVTGFGAVVLLLNYRTFKALFGEVVWVSAFAFGVHVLVMAGLVAVIFWPGFVRRFLHWGVGVAASHTSFVKDRAAADARIDAEVDTYAGAAQAAVHHAGVVVGAIAITVGQLILYYTIPYCVLRALGVTGQGFVLSFCEAAFVQLIMTAVPLPGGSGGAEGGFAVFFGPLLGSLTAAGVVLWRFTSFYLPILVCVFLLRLRSKVGPSQRLDTYGEVRFGREGARDAARIAKASIKGRVISLKRIRDHLSPPKAARMVHNGTRLPKRSLARPRRPHDEGRPDDGNGDGK